jgi:hypothetical protein
MIRYIYLAAIIFSAAGILLLDRRMKLGAFGPRLMRAVALTVPVFLVIDAVGAARGWFTDRCSDRAVALATAELQRQAGELAPSSHSGRTTISAKPRFGATYQRPLGAKTSVPCST